VAGSQTDTKTARGLSLLVMLLMALHVLFGVTGLMAALIAHLRLGSTTGTRYHSQLLWLIVTFWVAVAGYIVTFVIWQKWGPFWPVLIVFAWVGYRLLVHYYHWKKHQPMTRLL